jgi:hypothetical protein
MFELTSQAHRPESDDGYNNKVHFITSNSKVRISSEKKRLVTEVEFEKKGMRDSSADTVGNDSEFVRSNSLFIITSVRREASPPREESTVYRWTTP